MTLELSICILLNFKNSRWEYSTVERMGVYFSWAFTVMWIIFFIFVIWLLFCGKDKSVMERLLKPKYFFKVGTLYEELRFDSEALYLPLFFMLERIIFAVLSIHWGHSLG